jgi:ankyrin repeat protein
MMYAKERPSSYTLRVIVALSERPHTAEALESRLSSVEYISEACQNLLRLPSRNEIFASATPIHFSFIEYLYNLPLDNLQGSFWKPLTDTHDAESVLACRCTDWLWLELPRYWHLWFTVITPPKLCYPINFFDKHALRATNGSSIAPADLLVSINQLLDASISKLAMLVAYRSEGFAFRDETLGFSTDKPCEFDESLIRDYLLWTSNLCLVPGIEVDWTKLLTAKYALHLAAWYRPGKLEYLLSNGHCVNVPDSSGRTPLSYACEKGSKISAKILLGAGASLDVDTHHTSALDFPVRDNDLELTKVLLDANINVNVLSGPHGRVPLMVANSLEMVKLLCEDYSADINASDLRGNSVLTYFVSETERVNITEAGRIFGYLMSRGADPYTKSKAGMTLIDHVTYHTMSVGSLQSLLHHDSKLFRRETQEWTSLHWACRKGDLQLAEILFKHGQEVTKVTTLQPPRSWTPYDIWIHSGFEGGKRMSILRAGDQSILNVLGRVKDIDLDTKLPEAHIDYSKLMVDEIGGIVECQLCGMGLKVCHQNQLPSIELLIHNKDDLIFDCATCESKICFMCNHTLHSNQLDHTPDVSYTGRTGTV